MSYNEKIEGYEPELREPDYSYGGSYTAADYITWKTRELLELIRGKIFRMSPAPSAWHQRVFKNLYDQIKETHRAKSGCEIWLAPFDVFLIHPGEDWKNTKNIVEPDLCIVCDTHKIQKRGCIGAPDFVVEILSPSTRKKDATLKLELYQEYGVREYWMISIAERMIIVNLLNKHGIYDTQKPVLEGQILSPRDFPEITIDLNELFRDIPEED